MTNFATGDGILNASDWHFITDMHEAKNWKALTYCIVSMLNMANVLRSNVDRHIYIP